MLPAMPRAKKTIAQRAREAHEANPELGLSEIAEQIGASRQNVYEALSPANTGVRGRPVKSDEAEIAAVVVERWRAAGGSGEKLTVLRKKISEAIRTDRKAQRKR